MLLDETIWRGNFFLDGWRAGSSLADVTDKAAGTAISQIGVAIPDDVADAAESARDAQPGWYAIPAQERARILRKAASLVEEHTNEITPWLIRETGSIRPKVDFELKMAAGILNNSANMLSESQTLTLPSAPGCTSVARRLPRGVIGVIAPFNVPLVLAMRAVAPALAVGNAVVLKPAIETAVVGGILIARLFELAGLPASLLHVLPGGVDVGEAICTDPNIAMVAFTGSTKAGRRVGELCGKNLKHVSLELGGKNSMIVLDDADLDLAASNAAFGSWLHQGQVCMATGRILATRKVAEGLLDRLTEKAQHLPIGDPAKGPVALGPLISERQVNSVHAIVTDTVSSGANLRAGGTHKGLFYHPTVLGEVTPAMRGFREEIFGPVACVTTVADDEDAVRLANQTEYGLSASIISGSVPRAMELGKRLNVGLLHINDHNIQDEPQVPFGGRGASGNGTSIGGPANWEEFTQWQWVTSKNVPPKYPF